MPIHRLTIARNHMLAELATGFALIDTGSPVSYGGGRRLEIGDSRSEPPLGPVALLHEISREVGVEVDWLSGASCQTRSGTVASSSRTGGSCSISRAGA